jgi:hypothetical protein
MLLVSSTVLKWNFLLVQCTIRNSWYKIKSLHATALSYQDNKSTRTVNPETLRDWWPYPPVGPASWTMGTEKLKLCTIGKKLFCTGPTGSAGQFFMLLLPSKIHRLNSVSTGNETVNFFMNFRAFRVGHALFKGAVVWDEFCSSFKAI